MRQALRRAPFRRRTFVVPVDPPTSGAQFGTLQTLDSHGTAEKAGGLDLAMVELEWRYWQPTADANGVGIRNTGVYVANVVANIRNLLNLGMRVTIGTGLHHPPAWVSSLNGANVLYTNQAGQQSTAAVLGGEGFDAIDFTLSAKARQLAEAYIADVKAALGTTDWNRLTSIRDALSNTGEQMYPQRANSGYDWWGYSARAQAGTGLAAGMVRAPNTGVPTGTQIAAWLDWYIDARAKTSMWMIDYLCGTLAFPGAVDVITPGSGVRPDAWATLRARTTMPTANVAGVGAVWHVLYGTLNAGPWASRTWMHCSSVGDGSGSNSPSIPTDDDLALTATAANAFGSARWFHFMSGKFTNLGGLAGENPGAGTGYATTMMGAALTILASGARWKRFYWAHEGKLWDGTIPIQGYYDSIYRYRNIENTVPVPTTVEPGWTEVWADGFDSELPIGSFIPNGASQLTTGAAAATQGAKYSMYPFVNTTHAQKPNTYPILEGEPGYVAGQTNYWPPINSKWSAPDTVEMTGSKLRIHQHSEIKNGVLTALGAGITPKIGEFPTGADYMLGPYVMYEFRVRAVEVMRGGVDLAAAGDITSGLPIYHIMVPLMIDSAFWPDNSELDGPDMNLNRRIKFTYIRAAPTLINPQVFMERSIYDWTTVRVIWEPGRVRYIVDGATIYDTTDRIADDPMAIVLQFECDYRQPAADSSGIVEIDYLRVWQYTDSIPLAQDNFTRTSTATGIGTSSGLQNRVWSNLLGTMGITGNAAYNVTGPSLAVMDVGASTHKVGATLAALPSATDQYMGVAARVIDASNYYFADVNSAGAGRFFKVVSGTATQLGSFSGFTAGDRLELWGRGTWWSVFRNGTRVMNPVSARELVMGSATTPGTDKFMRTGTKVGLRYSSSAGATARWTNFAVSVR